MYFNEILINIQKLLHLKVFANCWLFCSGLELLTVHSYLLTSSRHRVRSRWNRCRKGPTRWHTNRYWHSLFTRGFSFSRMNLGEMITAIGHTIHVYFEMTGYPSENFLPDVIARSSHCWCLNNSKISKLCQCQNKILCGAIITWSIFSQIFTKDTP